MEEMVEVKVKLDPRNSLVHSVLATVLEEGDQEANGQIIADVVMALAILCIALDVDANGIPGMVDAALPNARKAAPALVFAVDL